MNRQFLPLIVQLGLVFFLVTFLSATATLMLIQPKGHHPKDALSQDRDGGISPAVLADEVREELAPVSVVIQFDEIGYDLGEKAVDCMIDHQDDVQAIHSFLNAEVYPRASYLSETDISFQIDVDITGYADGVPFLIESGPRCAELKAELSERQQAGTTFYALPRTCNEILAAVRGARCMDSLRPAFASLTDFVDGELDFFLSWQTFSEVGGQYRGAHVTVRAYFDVADRHAAEAIASRAERIGATATVTGP